MNERQVEYSQRYIAMTGVQFVCFNHILYGFFIIFGLFFLKVFLSK